MVSKTCLSFLIVLSFCLVACHSIDESTATLTSLTQASEYNVQLGLAYLHAGDIPRAKEKLLRAQRQAPRSSTVKSAMGYFLATVGEWKAAESCYLQAIRLNSKAGEIHNNYGSFLCDRERYREAESQFLLAVQDTDYLNTASAYENAGLCALRASHVKKAIQYFHKALAHDPNLQKSLLALARIYAQQGQYHKAKQYLGRYRQVVALYD